jgi:hypothetical protein
VTSAVPNSIKLIIAMRIAALMFVMAVERAEHKPEPVGVLAWL